MPSVQASAQEFGAAHVLLPGDRAVLDLLAAVKRASFRSFLQERRQERIEGDTPKSIWSEQSRATLLCRYIILCILDSY